jgi:glucose/arabinose dehydrogenase
MAPQPPQERRLARLIAVLAVLALSAAACGSDEPDGPDGPDGVGSPDPPLGQDEAAPQPEGTEPLDAVPLTLAPVANLQYPTAMAARAGSSTLYVTEQAGRVRALRPGPDGVLSLVPQPVLDVSAEVGPDDPGGEPGLLGITFSADGSRMYLSYTASLAPEQGWLRRITEWQMAGDLPVAASRRGVLEVHKDHPQHNGGDVRVGPDGYLYTGIGDTAPVADAFETGQDPTDLLGGILRIDPSATAPGRAYGIPADNPWASGTFEGQAGRPEVWLYGTRNPWRLSFDRETGDLWVADVGDQRREEITFLPAAEGAGRGANLGWSQMEGTAQYRNRTEPDDHVGPIYDYPHSSGGCSVIGGYVYRGAAIPALEGTYVFSDFCQPDLQGLRVLEHGGVAVGALGASLPDSVLAFGEDADGELYVLSASGVYAVLPGDAGGPGVTATTSR